MRYTTKVDCIKFLEDSLGAILGSRGLAFGKMTQKDIPKTAGLYLITVGELFYFRRVKNLQDCIIHQVSGNETTSPLIRRLHRTGKSVPQAKDFLRQNAVARWIKEEDIMELVKKNTNTC